MATNAYVEIDLSEANDLADLTGIRRDLETARDFALLLRDLRQREQWDSILIDALTTATLVRYCRAFVEGKRQPLNALEGDFLSALTPDQLVKHEEFRAYRNKHIAHSVNAFEENIPIARYWVERVREEGIEQISCNTVVVAGMSVPDMEAVVELTTLLISRIDEKLRAEKARVLEIVRKLPLEQVLRGPKMSRETTIRSKADDARKRFGNAAPPSRRT